MRQLTSIRCFDFFTDIFFTANFWSFLVFTPKYTAPYEPLPRTLSNTRYFEYYLITFPQFLYLEKLFTLGVLNCSLISWSFRSEYFLRLRKPSKGFSWSLGSCFSNYFDLIFFGDSFLQFYLIYSKFLRWYWGG